MNRHRNRPRFRAFTALCYPLVKKAKQMRHFVLHFVAPCLSPAQVLPSATRPRLFAGD
jgi:hypothetical protein